MMRILIFRSTLSLIVITGLIPFEAVRVHAQDKILFLRLQMQNDSITIVQSNIRAGVLKPVRDTGKAGGIEYQCRSSLGSLLSDGVIDDPSIRRYEFEDPAQPGKLRFKVAKLKDVRFTLRIPFKEEISHIEFYRIGSAGTNSRLQNGVKAFLGSVEIHPEGGGR